MVTSELISGYDEEYDASDNEEADGSWDMYVSGDSEDEDDDKEDESADEDECGNSVDESDGDDSTTMVGEDEDQDDGLSREIAELAVDPLEYDTTNSAFWHSNCLLKIGSTKLSSET